MDWVPKLEILPASQRSLWPELREVPPEFTLYGGTAVALHLGHRRSVDFDFFAVNEFDPARLGSSISFLADSQVIQQERNTLTCVLDRGEPVKISFFGLPKIKRAMPAHIAPENELKVASLLDLAGMKALAVQQRAEAKDYVDIDAIMNSGIGLPAALAAAMKIHGKAFNPQITLKALSYFGDGDLPSLPTDVKNRILKAVLATDLNHLPKLDLP